MFRRWMPSEFTFMPDEAMAASNRASQARSIVSNVQAGSYCASLFRVVWYTVRVPGFVLVAMKSSR